LEEALEIFKGYKRERLLCRCQRQLAELLFMQEKYFEAKKMISDAIKIMKQNNDQHQQALSSIILDKILDKIRIRSHNVFIFAKAFPQVKVKGYDVIPIGMTTRFSSDFRQRILQMFKEKKRVVNIKFDTLTRETIRQISLSGCRVLHLSSDFQDFDHLCVEGKNGIVDYISLDDLQSLLAPEGYKVNIDVVVVAQPMSKRIAKAISELGVPHVVGFDFIDKQKNIFMQNLFSLPALYNCVYTFCEEFYKRIVEEKTIKDSFKLARQILFTKIKDLNFELGLENIDMESIGEGPILYPKRDSHLNKIFDSNEADERKILKPGKFIDTSNVRGPTNISKNLQPYTGRKRELYYALAALSNETVKVVNVFGLQGIGKTRFLHEVSYFLNCRNKFSDGIFYIALKRVRSVEQFKTELRKINIGGGQNLEVFSNLENKNILLVLDDIDTMLKWNNTQFEWFLMDLVNKFGVKVIMTSKQQFKKPERENRKDQPFY